MDTDDQDRTDAEGGQHQNIARAALVLSVLAASGTAGVRLADVTRQTGLSKTAAHRCLAGLTLHGMAASEEETSRFFLGDRIFAWFTTARERYELAERAAPFLQRLADETEDTVYFMLRRGEDAVCFARAEGRFPIKTLTLNVGESRPLGTNTGSLAILAFLSDADAEQIIKSRAAMRRNPSFSVTALRRMVSETRKRGYSWIDGQVMPGMSGVGIPIRDTAGAPAAALSIAAISSRLDGKRRQQIVRSLKEEGARMEHELAPLLGRGA